MWCAISKLCTKEEQEANTSNCRGTHSRQQQSDLSVAAECHSGASTSTSTSSCIHNTIDRLDDPINMDLQDSNSPAAISSSSSSYDSAQSKHRASVKWILSKAFNNRVPENLREPFYKDHENQEHLKPQISGALANAELYCLALGHIYSDPNYHNLNHWAILQTLSRKGVYDQEQASLTNEITETILIQTNPFRMNAHMAVIESIMILYAKEVASSDQIHNVIQRIERGSSISSATIGGGVERGLIMWLNSICQALQTRIEQEQETNDTSKNKMNRPTLPTSMSRLQDLSDGVALAALISYYCPDDVHWTDIHIDHMSYRTSHVSQSLHNIMLVYTFCERNLPPCTVFHMVPEDIAYMRTTTTNATMKHNVIVFLADLFNVLEIHPLKCVRYPGMMDRSVHQVNATSGLRNSQGVAHKRNLPPTVVTPIPDLRSGLDTPSPTVANFTVPRPVSSGSTLKKPTMYQSTSDFSEDSLFRRGDSDDSFVVHRNRIVPTLSSVLSSTTATSQSSVSTNDEPLLPARLRPSKEKQNSDSKADERGDGRGGSNVAAGKPSHWEDTRKNSYAGRRSRRNSFSDESQLTIENFGGSQDHLNFIGRNPDKDLGVHHRKISLNDSMTVVDCGGPVVPVRSSLQDARGSIQLSYMEFEKQDTEREKSDKMKRSNENLSSSASFNNMMNMKMKNNNNDEEDSGGMLNNKLASFAELTSKLGGGGDDDEQKKMKQNKGIHLVYMQHEKDDNMMPSKSSLLNKKSNGIQSSSSSSSTSNEKKTTTFATLPNTTTWQQQSMNTSNTGASNDGSGDAPGGSSSGSPVVMASQLNNIRMKLEEKRRHIESEKRRMELIMSKQRQKVGKAAFLQAVTKGKSSTLMMQQCGDDVGSGVGGAGAGDNNTCVNNSNNNINNTTIVYDDDDTTRTRTITINDDDASTCIFTSDNNKPQRPFTLKEITDDAQSVEHKWLNDGTTSNSNNGTTNNTSGVPFVETRKTPDIENMDLEQYQQSLAMMNNSLHDIQVDIQRLATQQNQIQLHDNMMQQQQQQQANVNAYVQQALQQQQQQQQQQQYHLYQQHHQYGGSQHNISSQHHLNQMHNMFSSVSHIPGVTSMQQQQQHYTTTPNEFYLHNPEQQQQVSSASSPTQRRTWSSSSTGVQQLPQQAFNIPTSSNRSPGVGVGDVRTWATSTSNHSSNNKPQTLSQQHLQEIARYQNGGDQHQQNQLNHYHLINSSPIQQPAPSPSSQHRSINRTTIPSSSNQHVHRQISNMLSNNMADASSLGGGGPVNLKQIEHQDRTLTRSSSALLLIHNNNNNSAGNTGNTGGTGVGVQIPSVDDMEPQNISFIGSSGNNTSSTDNNIIDGLNHLNITSGTRTYRIPSPTRLHHHQHATSLTRNTFSKQLAGESDVGVDDDKQSTTGAASEQKGFYISFDDNDQQPKRPKPPLRNAKSTSSSSRSSPKKERSSDDIRRTTMNTTLHRTSSDVEARARIEPLSSSPLQQSSHPTPAFKRDKSPGGAAIIIGSEPDPNSLDEMEKKKERIMLLSLQRRQQQEEMKARKECEMMARREREKAKEEERARKKEAQAERRQAILEQYKLKKAIEEAEREGKILDRTELMNTITRGSTTPSSMSMGTNASSGGSTKLRGKTTGRPRPKTIHVDSGSVEMAEGMLTPSRGKKGSTSNLTSHYNNNNNNSSSNTLSSMRRDYYRGSHDSLAGAGTTDSSGAGGGSLYRDSPDDGRGASPSYCNNIISNMNQTLGRRASYKTTSRDNVHQPIRGRSKYMTTNNNNNNSYQSTTNMRSMMMGGGSSGGARKSNSMMNLCGSSSDQDSMMYRYGDTDSGLGRATPPRRAPSPGMGGGGVGGAAMRHLTSPSGPGSLPPGLMTTNKRRMFDDGCSDISSTPSSMMDYSGPRLYKQPATKSNRGIMLNAVEYCVFPGVVNKEAKNRVLEEIARSESKHFLILFRDAGCQFRALYSYCPEREEVAKLYGTGPKQVNDRMFDKFFKYNSGGKCFSQVHTKHLTVTIDAFTIHNSLWQGKKVNLPNKKDMALVI